MKYNYWLDDAGRVVKTVFPANESLPTMDFPHGFSPLNQSDWRVDGENVIFDKLPEPQDDAPENTPQADTDALLVDHELRLTMLELGL